MSGHSKWAQIRHKKAALDLKKGKVFSRLSRMITITARESGSDWKTNPKLARVIEEAREANMPSENIERAIKRAQEKESSDLKEVLYEAYGPGGSALLIVSITDNSNRTTNEIRHILSQYDSKLGREGSALWAFRREGKDFISKFPLTLSGNEVKKFEELLEELSGHDDIQEVYSNAQLP